MTTESSQGKIPLEDMRERGLYSEAVDHEPQRSTLPENHPLPEDDASEAEDLGFTTVHRSEAIPPEHIPTRRQATVETSIKKPTVQDEPEDDDTRRRKRSKSITMDESEDPSFSTGHESVEKDDIELEVRMRRHIKDLRRKMATLETEKQIAQEKADRATERLTEVKDLLKSGMSDVDKDVEVMASELKMLRKDNAFLKEQVSDAQSHIFSLQPYRKDLTAQEVGREYDELIELVQDWVQKFMEPFTDDLDKGMAEVVHLSHKQPNYTIRFKKALKQYPDLVHATSFPEMDEDIVIAMIMRFLHDNIFQKIMYGEGMSYTQMISFIENSMQSAVEPKRDLFSVRTWTAEAYNALMSVREFNPHRERRRKELTTDLANTLHIFCKRDKFQWFCENMEKNCIVPAMKLYEKMQVSTHHFYLDINPYIMWDRDTELMTSPEFMDSLDKLNCLNILQNRKAFNLAKQDPPPSKKELYHCLTNICTVMPALCMRQIGQKDTIKEPIVVRKQQMLVAWGDEERRQKILGAGERPIISQIWCNSKSEKQVDGSWSFRWLGQ